VKNLDLPDPGITWTAIRVDDGYKISLTSKNLAKNVFLSCEIDGFFTDNYFDILPGRTKTVDFVTGSGEYDSGAQIRVVSMADIR
jgi:beta-mannosidase